MKIKNLLFLTVCVSIAACSYSNKQKQAQDAQIESQPSSQPNPAPAPSPCPGVATEVLAKCGCNPADTRMAAKVEALSPNIQTKLRKCGGVGAGISIKNLNLGEAEFWKCISTESANDPHVIDAIREIVAEAPSDVNESVMNAWVDCYRDVVQPKRANVEASTYKKMAETALYNGDHEKCAELYQKVVQLTPDDANAQNNLGMCAGPLLNDKNLSVERRIEMGQLARDSFKRASELGQPEASKNYATACAGLGIVFVERQQWAEAINHLNVALGDNNGGIKKEAILYLYRGAAYRKLNSLDKSLEDLNIALSLHPSGQIHYEIALTLLQRQPQATFIDEAISHLSQAAAMGHQPAQASLDALNKIQHAAASK